MSAASRLPAAFRLRFLAWGLAMAAVLALFTLRVLPDPRIDTDILSLLPQAGQDRELDAALQAYSARLARRQIFLIGSESLDDAKLAATRFAAALSASDAFARVELTFDADLRRRAAVYLAHRAYLLAPADAHALVSTPPGSFVQRAVRAAYSPASFGLPLSLAEDPLALVNNFLSAQQTSWGQARLDSAMLVVDDEKHSYVLVLAESQGSAFASSVQQRVMPAIASAQRAAREGLRSPVQILASGAIQHAAAAAERAEREIATFGTIEGVAVVLLLLLVFGSMRPLLLGALTLALAVTAAYTTVHVLFGGVHVLTLVFGSSLIGSVIDYSIHFFADRFREPARWTPVDALRHVGPAILLGLTTTVLGYVVLAIVPFPGLKQIAVFCMTGLIVGCGCVLCLYPVLMDRGTKHPPRLGSRVGGAIDRRLRDWTWTTPKMAAIAALATAVLLGITRLHVQDDVKALQQSPPQLRDAELRMRELLGSGIETRFFLVTGASAQAVLENEERLTAALSLLVNDGAIASYQAVSDSLPSEARQRRNHALLSQRVYAPGALLDQVMSALGFPPAAIEKRRAEFAASSGPLGVDEWLESAAMQTRHLWLGSVGQRHASIVTLGGIDDVAALTVLDLPDVRLIDRVAETSGVLSRYRRIMSLLLAAVYLIAGLVLLSRFGWRDAPRMLLPSLAATLLTLGLFGWLGVPFNLFTLLAFWLVLGLGVDYGIFLRHGRDSRPTAILSVTLSACTTLIAFGLLALSATPFIRSIGITLLCAITLSWLLVLLACLTNFTRPVRNEKTIHA
jgi:predicted exporter